MRINLYAISALSALSGALLGAFLLKRAERNIYEFALQHPSLSPSETLSLQINIGLSYAKQKKYKKTTEYFDEVFHARMELGFVYTSIFKNIVQAYLKSDQKEKAKQVLLIMLYNKGKDKRYKKLEKKFSFLLD